MSGSWRGSDRRERLPANWPALRRATARRAGGMCEAPGCGREGAECDHIVPGDNHSEANLQWLCKRCHARKSAAEGVAARGGSRSSRRRPAEKHPGLR